MKQSHKSWELFQRAPPYFTTQSMVSSIPRWWCRCFSFGNFFPDLKNLSKILFSDVKVYCFSLGSYPKIPLSEFIYSHRYRENSKSGTNLTSAPPYWDPNRNYLKLIEIVNFSFTGFNAIIPGFPSYMRVGDVSHGVYNLRIRNVSLSDDAEFQCQVGPAQFHKPIRANAKLTVISKYAILLFINTLKYHGKYPFVKD